MKSTFISIIVVLGAVYICLGVLLYVMQRQILYSPTPEIDGHNLDFLVIQSEQELIKIVRLNAGKRRAILYFGGNVEQVSDNSASFGRIFKDRTVYLVNYRGYSGSTGSPTERTNYIDALNIYDQLIKNHDSISIIGRSLGSAIATYVAVNREIDELALITPLDSVEQVAKLNYPIFPVSIMLKDKYDSYSRAHLIKVPTLVIIAEYDEIIPRISSDRLVERLNKDNAQVSVIPNVTHNTIDANGEYSRLLAENFK